MFDKPEHNNLFIAFSITVLICIGVSSVAPVLPTISRHFQIDHVKASLLITFFTLPGIVFLPIAGFLTDRYGRKVVLLSCLISFAIAGTACSQATEFHHLLMLRVIQGLSAAPFGMLSSTIIGDTFRGAELGRVVGYNTTILNIGLALAPGIGGNLALIHWKFVFIIPALALLTAFTAVKAPLGKPKETLPPKIYFTKFLEVLRHKKTMLLLSLGFFNLLMVFGPLLICLPLLLDAKYQASSAQIGYIMGTLAISAAIAGTVTGRLLAVNSPQKLLLIGQSCVVLAMFLIPLTPYLWLHFLPVLLLGIGNGMSATSVMSTVIVQAPMGQRASLMSVYGVSLCLAQTLGPLFFGGIAKFGGVNIPFFVASCIAVLMGTITFLFNWDR